MDRDQRSSTRSPRLDRLSARRIGSIDARLDSARSTRLATIGQRRRATAVVERRRGHRHRRAIIVWGPTRRRARPSARRRAGVAVVVASRRRRRRSTGVEVARRRRRQRRASVVVLARPVVVAVRRRRRRATLVVAARRGRAAVVAVAIVATRVVVRVAAAAVVASGPWRSALGGVGIFVAVLPSKSAWSRRATDEPRVGAARPSSTSQTARGATTASRQLEQRASRTDLDDETEAVERAPVHLAAGLARVFGLRTVRTEQDARDARG